MIIKSKYLSKISKCTMQENDMKIKVILLGTVACILLVLYSYFVADTIVTRITDAQMTKVDGRFMIATDYRPFVNYDAKYRLKFNSGTVQNDAIKLRGQMVKIKKYGWRIPIFSMYENIVKIEEEKATPPNKNTQ